MTQSNLAGALRVKFGRTGALDDLNAAIKAGRAAVQSVAADHPHRAAMLSNLGSALRARFERAGALEDLDAGIEAEQAAVQATPANHPHRAAVQSHLAEALRARFVRTGGLEDLNEAIKVARAAVQATPADHPGWASHMSNLGNTLHFLFERTGVLEDLDEAINVGRAAVQATPADHPGRAAIQSNLAGALRARFDRTAALEDLDAAIGAERAAVQAVPADGPERAGTLSNLGAALQTRFERTGTLEDLNAAIKAGRAAVQAVPPDHPKRAQYLTVLGIALRARFERTGALEDLDEAIKVAWAAVQATPADHPDRAGRLSNLGGVLRARFERTGALADLEAAIKAEQAAVQATPADHPGYAVTQSNLAGALRVKFGRTGALDDLNAAIKAGRAAVQSVAADHPHRAAMLSNLGSALRARFERAGALEDLDAGIEAEQAAVQAVPADHPEWASHMSNLGNALQVLFERTGALADLDAAIEAGEAAVQAIPADHPNMAIYLSSLGIALRARFDRAGMQEDLDAALSCYVQAVGIGSTAPSMRIRAARVAAALAARSEPGRAADLLDEAVRLLPEVTPRQLDRADQQFAIGGFAGLSGDAAALVLADPDVTGDVRARRALRLLEAGRAVLLSQTLDTRSDLTDLRQHHAGLAARFEQLRDRLDQHADTPAIAELVGLPDPMTWGAEEVERRRRAADELAATLTRIRSLPGFASFGLPPTTGDLQAQAALGPIVTCNISAYRCDALLLTSAGITSVELPALTRDSLTAQINAFHQALYTISAPAGELADRRAAQRAITAVLEWLWDVAAGPVLNALGYDQCPSPAAAWPRVWWAPGGVLGLLPIHAAGHHTEPVHQGQAPRTVMDRVVSSYTPTIRALGYARRHGQRTAVPGRALIVGMPATPGLPDGGELPYVPAEVDRLSALLPDPVILSGPSTRGHEFMSRSSGLPTRANVFEHLPECPIAHFACHGFSDPADPSKSLLLLNDYDTAPFTVASLAPIRHDHLQLVYLSACRTAFTPAVDLLDEAIHLTSAFQLAGARHVIGTMWEIDDALAVDIATSFYRSLGSSPVTLDIDRAAYALHQAVRTVRDQHLQTPSLWAAYLHAGA